MLYVPRRARENHASGLTLYVACRYDDLLFEKEDIEQKLLTAQDQARFVEKGPNSKKTEVLKSVIRTLEVSMSLVPRAVNFVNILFRLYLNRS